MRHYAQFIYRDKTGHFESVPGTKRDIQGHFGGTKRDIQGQTGTFRHDLGGHPRGTAVRLPSMSPKCPALFSSYMEI